MNNLFNAAINHPDYLKSIYQWQLCRDAIEGESAIKSRNTIYLPMPSAMTIDPENSHSHTQQYSSRFHNELTTNAYLSSQYNPNYHPNDAYRAYLTRAQFPELTSFILRGLLGLVTRYEPTIHLPPQMEYLNESATKTGQSLLDYYYYIISEIVSVGRLVSVIDVAYSSDNANGQLKFVPYKAESLVNWSLGRPQNSSEEKPLVLVLTEEVPNPDEAFSYDREKKANFRVLVSINGIYETVLIPEDDFSKISSFEQLYSYMYPDLDLADERVPSSSSSSSSFSSFSSFSSESATPSFQGKPFKEIPAVCFGPLRNSYEIQNSPLSPIASSSLQIYMKNADLSNSEFMSCSPTLVITGVDAEFAPKAVGSTVALVIPNEEAKAYYTTTDTSALSHVLNHIESLHEQAIYAGAQLLDSSKKAAESAETVRLKQTASGATMVSIVYNAAKGLEDQLKVIAIQMGLNPDDVSVIPTKDFLAPALTAQEQTALVMSWSQGAITQSTLLYNFRKAGLLREGISNEQELDEAIKEIEAKMERDQVMKPDQNVPNGDIEDKKVSIDTTRNSINNAIQNTLTKSNAPPELD